MAGKNETLNELNRKNMEAAMRLAQLSIENSQRVMSLQSDLARELFNDGVSNAKAQASAKDPQEVLRLRAQYAQDTAQKMMATAQKVAVMGNDARVEFARMVVRGTMRMVGQDLPHLLHCDEQQGHLFQNRRTINILELHANTSYDPMVCCQVLSHLNLMADISRPITIP